MKIPHCSEHDCEHQHDSSKKGSPLVCLSCVRELKFRRQVWETVRTSTDTNQVFTLHGDLLIHSRVGKGRRGKDKHIDFSGSRRLQ